MTEYNEIIKRIDKLIDMCSSFFFVPYKKVVYEIEGLIISIAGKQSEQYSNFINVANSKSFNSEKLEYFIGILNSLKNKLLLKNLNFNSNLNWEYLLNTNIRAVSIDKFNDGYYSESVESAIKELNTKAKNLYKKYRHVELDGAILFANIFSNDPSNCLMIAGTDLDSQSGKDEQEGYRLLFMGLWKSIRNPNAHANKDMSQEQAKQILIFVSMLMTKFEECMIKSQLNY